MTPPEEGNSPASSISSASKSHSELKGKDRDNKSEGKKRALIISISTYNRLQPLDFCQKDGEEMYSLLKMLEYEISDNNKLIGEIKHEKLQESIYDFFDNANAKDTLLFYFSGHGIPDAHGDI